MNKEQINKLNIGNISYDHAPLAMLLITQYPEIMQQILTKENIEIIKDNMNKIEVLLRMIAVLIDNLNYTTGDLIEYFKRFDLDDLFIGFANATIETPKDKISDLLITCLNTIFR